MFALHRTLTLRYLFQRRARALLIILSIALGVAAFVATRTLNETLTQVAQGAVTPFARKDDLVIVNGQAGVPVSLVEELRTASMSGIRQASPIVLGRAGVPELDARGVTVVGVDFDATQSAGQPLHDVDFTITAGPADLFNLIREGRTPVVLGETLAARVAASPSGKRFRLRLGGVEVPCTAVGTVRLTGNTGPLGGDMLFLPLEPAVRLVYPARPDYVTRINLQLEPGVDAEAVRRRAQEIAGSRAEVRTTEADYATAGDVTAGLELGVALGGVGALVIGMFLVYNALAVTVAERRHDIGILRSAGATRGQIVQLFVGEATLLGLAGSFLGLPLGLALAWTAMTLLVRGMASDFGGVSLDQTGLHIAVTTVLLSQAAGLATAIFASLVPALQAASEDPAHAVRRIPAAARIVLVMAHVAVCLALVAVGAVSVVFRAWLPLRVGAFLGFVCLLVVAILATPLLAAIHGRLLQPLFRRVLTIEGRLAADNLVKSPGRTGIVIAALAATGGLLVSTAGFIRSTELTLLSWIEEQVGADLFVTAGGSINNAAQAYPMSDDIGRKLRALPGVAAALPVRGFALDFRQHLILMMSVDARAFHGSVGDHALARNLERFPDLVKPGTVLASHNFAALYGVAPGDHLTVPGLKGPLEVTVIGTITDFTWNRGILVADQTWFREQFGDDQVDIYDVFLKPGVDPQTLQNEVTQMGRADGLVVQTRAELRGDISSTLHRVYSLAYAQQFVIGLVALMGVTSALFISVLQRRRELGLLRAVGASRAQVLRSVLAEASLMGLFGAVLGFAIGLVLEYYVLKILILDDAGWVFALHIPWTAAAVVFGSSVVTATIVGLWPAYEATRMRIPEAIAYE